MRERLRIGEGARLVGVTPKTVRHYEKIGLLRQAERSDSGYRLYSADDLLRLHRVRKLQSLGLSLKRVRDVLGEADQERSLRDILKTLRAEVDAEMYRHLSPYCSQSSLNSMAVKLPGLACFAALLLRLLSALNCLTFSVLVLLHSSPRAITSSRLSS